MKNIILASASPRRIEMMQQNGFKPMVIAANIDETLPFDMTPEASVMYLAFKKACNVANSASPENAIIIAADTVVVFKNKIIGKPQNRDEAFNILSNLRNNHHHVITGVSIIEIKNRNMILKTCFCDKTSVYFKNYSDEALNKYINTSEPYDKAGAYAIQGTFGKYIDHFEGDYNNVVGLPWRLVKPYLK